MELKLITTALEVNYVLPALSLLAHNVNIIPPRADILVELSGGDLIIVDATRNLSEAKEICKLLKTIGAQYNLTAIFKEGGLVALKSDWFLADFFINTIAPIELETRLRLLSEANANYTSLNNKKIIVGDLILDESTYSVLLSNQPLDLTYKEFELLKFLIQSPGIVFSRTQLLQEVWGYDYLAGTRTVDVHIRRLRAKLGPEYEAMIATVRNVGYKIVKSNEARVG